MRLTAFPSAPGRLNSITAQTESGNNDAAISPKGARGAMQVMPGTSVNPGFGVAPARDGGAAELNRVGRDYRAAMFARYDDPAKGWAAYNWGPGNIDKVLRHGEDWWRHLPSETLNYVARNMRAMRGQ